MLKILFWSNEKWRDEAPNRLVRRREPAGGHFIPSQMAAHDANSGSGPSGRPWAEESLLPSDPRARPRLQDRVHPRLPEPAGALRTRIRRGLLKGEQLHALARCVHYGRLGRLDQRDFERQTSAASCLLLILAAIIYWQIREIDRVLSEAGSDADDLNFEVLSHISPIGWDNVLLYGEYQLNRSLVRSEKLSV